mmetsp:Transcript_3091/g.10125  ORF Transcript_3091/g.10125 Transcript_3091/m.10125 type:complete len:394 (+) Transcript_3091:555-1736(+)
MASPAVRAHGKRKVGIVLGYLGTRFGGSQPVRDVGPSRLMSTEEVLADALTTTGYLPADHAVNLSKASWTRASRTDRGTHSLALGIGVKLSFARPALGDMDATLHRLTDEVNGVLPDDVRMLAAVRVPKSFAARRRCAERWYEYWYPVPAGDAGTMALNADELAAVAADCLVGSHTFHNFTRLRAAAIPARLRHRASEMAAYADLAYDQPDSYAAHVALYPADLMQAAFNRVVVAVDVEAVEREGQAWLRFHFRGSAFLYEQVRRMVAALIGVAHGWVSPDALRLSLGESPASVRWPAAPADYLILDNALYHSMPGAPDVHALVPLAGEPGVAAGRAFRDSHVLPALAQVAAAPTAADDLAEMQRRLRQLDLAEGTTRLTTLRRTVRPEQAAP